MQVAVPLAGCSVVTDKGSILWPSTSYALRPSTACTCVRITPKWATAMICAFGCAASIRRTTVATRAAAAFQLSPPGGRDRRGFPNMRGLGPGGPRPRLKNVDRPTCQSGIRASRDHEAGACAYLAQHLQCLRCASGRTTEQVLYREDKRPAV